MMTWLTVGRIGLIVGGRSAGSVTAAYEWAGGDTPTMTSFSQCLLDDCGVGRNDGDLDQRLIANVAAV